jgi:hypothetical protein
LFSPGLHIYKRHSSAFPFLFPLIDIHHSFFRNFFPPLKIECLPLFLSPISSLPTFGGRNLVCSHQMTLDSKDAALQTFTLYYHDYKYLQRCMEPTNASMCNCWPSVCCMVTEPCSSRWRLHCMTWHGIQRCH